MDAHTRAIIGRMSAILRVIAAEVRYLNMQAAPDNQRAYGPVFTVGQLRSYLALAAEADAALAAAPEAQT